MTSLVNIPATLYHKHTERGYELYHLAEYIGTYDTIEQATQVANNILSLEE